MYRPYLYVNTGWCKQSTPITRCRICLTTVSVTSLFLLSLRRFHVLCGGGCDVMCLWLWWMLLASAPHPSVGGSVVCCVAWCHCLSLALCRAVLGLAGRTCTSVCKHISSPYSSETKWVNIDKFCGSDIKWSDCCQRWRRQDRNSWTVV